MIDPGLFLAFIAAVILLMLTPGPNVALIVSNSVAYGSRCGLLTVAGTGSAMMAQLALTALGLKELLEASGAWFEGMRWIGVAYLVYLGIAQWRAPAIDWTGAVPPSPSRKKNIRARVVRGVDQSQDVAVLRRVLSPIRRSVAPDRTADRVVVGDVLNIDLRHRFGLGTGGGARPESTGRAHAPAQPDFGRSAGDRGNRPRFRAAPIK
jgi:hypothetical protein